MDRISLGTLKARGPDFTAGSPQPREAAPSPQADALQALDPGALAAKDKGPLLVLDIDAADGTGKTDGDKGETRSRQARPDDLAALVAAMQLLPGQSAIGPVAQGDKTPVDAESASAAAAGFLLLVEMFEGVLQSSRQAFSGWRKKMLRKAAMRGAAPGGKRTGTDEPAAGHGSSEQSPQDPPA